MIDRTSTRFSDGLSDFHVYLATHKPWPWITIKTSYNDPPQVNSINVEPKYAMHLAAAILRAAGVPVPAELQNTPTGEQT